MSKDFEELLFIGGGLLIFLTVFKGTSSAAATATANQNASYANAAAGVVTTALNDFSGD